MHLYRSGRSYRRSTLLDKCRSGDLHNASIADPPELLTSWLDGFSKSLRTPIKIEASDYEGCMEYLQEWGMEGEIEQVARFITDDGVPVRDRSSRMSREERRHVLVGKARQKTSHCGHGPFHQLLDRRAS